MGEDVNDSEEGTSSDSEMGEEQEAPPADPARLPQSEDKGKEKHPNEGQEEIRIRQPRNPKDPLPEERDQHWKTHLPYRAWCPVCVKARGREDPHTAQEGRDDGIEEIAMDYCDIGDRKLLVGRENITGHIFCHLVKCKGTGDENIVNKVIKSINNTGNTKIVLKTDGEPAIIQVQEKVIAERQHPTVPKNPPAYDPQSNGVAERAVQEVKCQLRALKLGLEARIKKEVDVNSEILEWMIPHAADCINKYLVGKDGRTAHYRVHLKNFSGKVFEIGEQVLAKPKRSNKKIKKRQALDARFHDATWVGFDARSNEHVVILGNGGPAIKVRTVKPRPEGDKWSAEAIEAIVATPDVPNPKDETQRDLRSERNTKGLDFGAKGGHELPRQRTQHEPGLTRNFRIGNRLLEKYGVTPGCKGCEAKLAGDDAKPHSAECRARIEDAMLKDDEEAGILAGRDTRKQGEEQPPAQEPQEQASERAEQAAAAAAEPEDRTTPEAATASDQPGNEAENKRAIDAEEAPESKRQRLVQLGRRERIRESVKNVLEHAIRTGSDQYKPVHTHSAIEALSDSLDEACTRKTERKARRVAESNRSGSHMKLAEAASDLGYNSNLVLDLVINPATNELWDWSRQEDHEQIDRMIDDVEPWLIRFPLESMNVNKEPVNIDNTKNVQDAVKASAHASFVKKICMKQAAAGRKFCVEWPAKATMHGLHELRQLYFAKGARSISGRWKGGNYKARKIEEDGQVAAVTNSMAIVGALRRPRATTDETLNITCQAISKERTEAENTEIINKQQVQATVNAINLLMKIDEEKATETLDAINAMENTDGLYDQYDFFDDVTGQELDKELATEARKLEMKFFRDMKVYEKVPRWHAARDGCKVITTRWLDVNKGDRKNPNYRSRLVGREIKTDSRLDLFAATPPLESLRLMCSICASNQDGPSPYRIMAVDVKRAYFYAKVTRPVYIEIPIEDFEPGDEGRVAKLNLSLYGTRDAAQNWAREYTTFLKECGFEVGVASPCNFRHEYWGIALTVHGDDFTATGPTASLKWLQYKMGKRYDIKTKFLGPEAGMEREMQVLNRTICWDKRGVTYEADQRHAEIVINEMGLRKGKSVVTPALPEASDEEEKRMKTPELDKAEASRYRALAARINYLSLDRADLQFAAKTISRNMARPREHDWGGIKRLARYLVGAPRAVQQFKWQARQNAVSTFVDSDWAGDKVSRKSTSGGAMCIGTHTIKTWSSTQQVIALSSGEAELYALVRGASQTKGLISVMGDFGFNLEAIVFSDASAAIGIAHRRGLGKTRHIQVQNLWVQEEIAEGRLAVKKVHTHKNPADIMTKAVPHDTMYAHMKSLDFQVDDTRAVTAPELQC